ncbi:MAG: hypothetical protein SGJ11_14070 [Phycisphaerae bacterium]|nr:hypothetical protein [Phycisphaerae bacterium]
MHGAACWKSACPKSGRYEYAAGDLTLDGTVDAADLALLLGKWSV